MNVIILVLYRQQEGWRGSSCEIHNSYSTLDNLQEQHNVFFFPDALLPKQQTCVPAGASTVLILICFPLNSLLDDSQKGPKSHLEILAEMRDYKRRRQSYRAKNVHITKKSYTEVGSLRESWEFSLCLVHISINNSIPVQTRKNLLCLLCPSWLEFANLLIRESLWFSLLQEVTGNRSISGSSEFFM